MFWFRVARNLPTECTNTRSGHVPHCQCETSKFEINTSRRDRISRNKIVMPTLWGRIKNFFLVANEKLSSLLSARKRQTLLAARSLLAILMAALLVVGPLSPAFAQSTAQNPPPNPVPPPSTAAQDSAIAPVSSLGLAKYNFTNGPRAFPSLLKPYQQIQIAQPVITNSPRLDQLIHDGKLELTLQDAVELALENSMDIAVQRYYPWIADAGMLKTKAGGFGYGTPGASFSSSTAAINPFTLTQLTFDPIVSSSVTIADISTPINNPFIS